MFLLIPLTIIGLAVSTNAENITLPINAKLAQSLRNDAVLLLNEAGSSVLRTPSNLSFSSSNAFNTLSI